MISADILADAKPSDRIDRIKKAAKLAGYGALVASGVATCGMVALAAWRDFMGDPANYIKIQKELDLLSSGCSCQKLCLWAKQYGLPQSPKEELTVEDPNKQFREMGALLAGSTVISGIGLGMIAMGSRGIKKTLHPEKYNSKEQQPSNIKQKMSRWAYFVWDLTKRNARLLGYSLSATIGAMLAGGSTWQLAKEIKAIIDLNEPCFSKKRYTGFNGENSKKKLVSSLVLFPVGTSALAFGIHGLVREYYSWKESKSQEEIANTVQSIKNAISNTVQSITSFFVSGNESATKEASDQGERKNCTIVNEKDNAYEKL